MTSAEATQVGILFSWIVLILAGIVLIVFLRRIQKGIANTIDLAVSLLMILVIGTMIWILTGDTNIWLKSGLITRIIWVMILVILFFVGVR